MVKFMCPNMLHHYKCMNCLQCYSLSMAKISQPPRKIAEFGSAEKSAPKTEASNAEETTENKIEETEEDEEFKEDEENDNDAPPAEVETQAPSNPESEQSHVETLPVATLVQEESSAAVEHTEEDDDIEVIDFQDLLGRRDRLAQESNCCATKTDLEKMLDRTNELLLMLATVVYYTGYALPYGSQQASPVFANYINPLRQYRHSLWNAAHKKAHNHNVSWSSTMLSLFNAVLRYITVFPHLKLFLIVSST